MKSQVKWGIAFILLSLALLLGYPITLIYSIPLAGIGLALIACRDREDKIEDDNNYNR